MGRKAEERLRQFVSNDDKGRGASKDKVSMGCREIASALGKNVPGYAAERMKMAREAVEVASTDSRNQPLCLIPALEIFALVVLLSHCIRWKVPSIGRCYCERLRHEAGVSRGQ